MKRDARIGLAVVLVLGLAVTLLVGRAIVKGGADNEADPEVASAGSAPYSADAARVDGAPTAHVAAAANTGIPDSSPAAITPVENANPAVQRFVDDQTRHLSAEAPSPANPNPVPPSNNRAPVIESPAPVGSKPAPVKGSAANTTPKSDHNDALDHEAVGPTTGVDADVPADGYGYSVASGDNMWKISSKVYGDGKFTQKIIDANPTLNTQKMKPGMVIKIPTIQNKTVLMKLPSFADASKNPAGAAVAAAKEAKKDNFQLAQPIAASSAVKADKGPEAISEATTHKVEAGESLGTIARKYYGFSGPKSVARIVSANNGLDPAKLKVGQELAIPAVK